MIMKRSDNSNHYCRPLDYINFAGIKSLEIGNISDGESLPITNVADNFLIYQIPIEVSPQTQKIYSDNFIIHCLSKARCNESSNI